MLCKDDRWLAFIGKKRKLSPQDARNYSRIFVCSSHFSRDALRFVTSKHVREQAENKASCPQARHSSFPGHSRAPVSPFLVRVVTFRGAAHIHLSSVNFFFVFVILIEHSFAKMAETDVEPEQPKEDAKPSSQIEAKPSSQIEAEPSNEAQMLSEAESSVNAQSPNETEPSIEAQTLSEAQSSVSAQSPNEAQPSIKSQTLSEAESSVNAQSPNEAEPTCDEAMQSDEEDNTSEDVPSHDNNKTQNRRQCI